MTTEPAIADPGDTKHGHRISIGVWFNRYPDGRWTFEVDWSGCEYEYSYDYASDINNEVAPGRKQSDYRSHTVLHTEMLDWLIQAAVDAGFLPAFGDAEEHDLPVTEDPLIRALR